MSFQVAIQEVQSLFHPLNNFMQKGGLSLQVDLVPHQQKHWSFIFAVGSIVLCYFAIKMENYKKKCTGL